MNGFCQGCGDEIFGPVRVAPDKVCVKCKVWIEAHPVPTQGERIMLHRLMKLEQAVKALSWGKDGGQGNG